MLAIGSNPFAHNNYACMQGISLKRSSYNGLLTIFRIHSGIMSIYLYAGIIRFLESIIEEKIHKQTFLC